MSEHEKVIKLIQHARKVAGDMLKAAYELREENREKAQKTLEYGKKVKESVDNLIFQDLSGTFEGQDLYTVVFVSVLPLMENSVNELTYALNKKPEPVEEEHVPTEEELEALLMENYKRFEEQEEKERNKE